MDNKKFDNYKNKFNVISMNGSHDGYLAWCASFDDYTSHVKKISPHCDPKFHSVTINNIGYQIDEVVPNCNVMLIYVDAVIDDKAMSFGYQYSFDRNQDFDINLAGDRYDKEWDRYEVIVSACIEDENIGNKILLNSYEYELAINIGLNGVYVMYRIEQGTPDVAIVFSDAGQDYVDVILYCSDLKEAKELIADLDEDEFSVYDHYLACCNYLNDHREL